MLLQPAAAFAIYETPGALFEAIRLDESARSFGGEAHAHFETYYVSAWFSGSQQGNTDPMTAKAVMKTTVDFVDTASSIKVRFKGQMAMTEGSVFLKLDSIEGSYADPVFTMAFNAALHKWIEVPMKPELFEMAREHVREQSEIMNELYDMVHTAINGGHKYELTFKPELVDTILSEFPMVSAAGNDRPFLIKINTTNSDVFLAASVVAGFGDDSANFRAQGTAQKLANDLVVARPKDSMTVEELQAHVPAFMGGGLGLPSFPVPTDEWEIPAGEEDDIWDDEELWDDEAQPVRTKPSRRELRRIKDEGVEKPYSRIRTSATTPLDNGSVLDDRGLSVGNANALVTIVEFGDYECPFCLRHFTDTFPHLKADYIDTGKIRYVFRNYPLSFHPGAMPAAIAVECALRDGQKPSWELHDSIYNAQDDGATLTLANLKRWAAKITGIDQSDFNSCMEAEKTSSIVDADIEAGSEAGVSGTPTFFVITNEGAVTQIDGAQPYEEFKKVLDKLLG